MIDGANVMYTVVVDVTIVDELALSTELPSAGKGLSDGRSERDRGGVQARASR